MENPFRSEAAAYRFVFLTLAAFGVIVAAGKLFGGWAGFVAWLVITAAVAWRYLHARSAARAPRQAPAVHAEGERRVLVVANETVGGRALADLIHERAGQFREEVLVVCPALNSPLRHWASDEDGARSEAQARLEQSLDQLRAAGVNARGEIGDPDPLQAIEDALRTFGPDEIVISTHPEGRSHWLEKGVVRNAEARFAVPITHVVVDLEAERTEPG